MAALAVQSVSEEIEKVTSENGIVETCSKTDNITLVALSSENIGAPIAKFSSDDSGILCKNDSETSSSASVKSVELDAEEGQQSQSQDQKTTEDKSSHESETNKCSLKSSQISSSEDNGSSPKKFADEDSNSSFNSTLKRSQSINNDDENSCSSVQSTSTVKTSQCATHKSDDESNGASSSKCSSSRKSSPQKSSQNTSFRSSQSARSDFTQDSNSCSSFRSSVSRSPTKASQSVSYKSDDDASKSSLKSSKKSTPEKHSQNDLTEDNDSRSSVRSSSSQSTVKNSQCRTEKHDDENSRSSFTSSTNKNSPQKSNDEKENKKKKYFSIIDSDSEDENTISEKSNVHTGNNQSPKAVSNSKNKNRKLIDSDSDEEIISVDKTSKKTDNDSDSGKEDSKVIKKPNKISNIIDSDSESDRESGSGNDSAKENSKIVQKSNKLSLIIDSDSESDRDQHAEQEHQDHSDNENDTLKSKKGKKKAEKKRTGSARASKDMAMQQIYSETQRLIRESQVSLPYHRPKQRTLEEFLNRKKTPSNLPKHFTNAERIKMFPEIISKVVKEKEKEAEDFYQSSDSEEDENDKTLEIEQVDDDNKNENDVQNSENSNLIEIFNTQKLTQDDIQESHNKKEILLQRSMDFGATRKLFVDDAIDMEESTKTETTEKHPEKSMESETAKILKDADKDSNVSRKLFTDTVESMDVDEEIDNHGTSMSEKKNEKEEENSNKKTDSPKKIIELENSTEDIVLNISETEHDSSTGKKIDKSNEIKDKDTCTLDEESAVLSETPSVSESDNLKSSETSNGIQKNNIAGDSTVENTKNLKDPILKLTADVADDDEIIDPNMLRADFFRAPDLDEPAEKELSIKEKILSSASKLKPMIKSSPGCVIDLTSAGPIKQGATKLLDRFLSRHIPMHKPSVDKVSEVKIVRTEGVGDDVKIIEEILPFKIAAVEDDKRERKPGERFKLKEDLMLKIASARDEEWKHKEEDEMEEDEEESKCRGDDFYEGLPDEEEELEDEETGESEPEEDDMPIVEKRRRTCEFGDEEAEESELDDDEDNEAEEDNQNEEEEEESEEEESESEKEEISQKPKKLRRIISAFDDESNQSESSNEASKKPTLERAKTDEDMFATQASNEYANPDVEAEAIPLFQFRERCDSDSRSQACKTPLPKSNNILSMISPVAQLTALNTSLESAKKSSSKTNNFNLGQISSQNTPTEASDRTQSNCNMEKMVSFQKKLFEDPPDSVNEDELLAICSGKFTDTQSSGVPAISTQNGVTDSQLMDICSGAFDTPSVEEKKTGVPAIRTQNGVTDSQLLDICSGAFDTPTVEEKKTGFSAIRAQNGVTDSQLLDICSGAFDTPTIEEKKTGFSAIRTQNGVTDSQLLDICSGVFDTPEVEEKKTDDTVLVGDETSQDITLAVDDDEESKSSPSKRSSSLKRSDESMFSSDSSKMSKSLSSDKEVFKNPMEAWLKKASAKPTQSQTQQKENGVTDSQLMGLCSGAFTSQPIDIKKLEENVESLKHDEVSQDFQLTLDDDNSNSSVKDIAVKPKDQETLLLDKKIGEEQPKIEPRLGLRIASSSEDEDGNEVKKKKPKKKVFRKKKVAKLQLSDDEDEPKEFSDEESEIEEDDEEKFVDYDSEENEVIVVPKKEIKKVAEKFLENEAELSESDWDSADEDEQGLDKLEFEEGDAEDIDEDKMKDELDRIHMKQVMDEDQRDVRMLQELLFDDGDLHSEGAGRERKFKWKNIDSMGTDELQSRTDDPTVIDDDVDTAVELQMRKMRYEKLKFQEEKEQNSKVLDDEFGDSTLSKTGLKVVSVRSIKKSLGEQMMNKSKSIDNPSNVVSKNTLNFTKKSLTTSFSFSNNMRGSFLARGEETLVRIAQNLPEKSSVSISSIRNKKFVFEHLSPTVSNAQKDDSEQENDNTPAKDKKGNVRKRKIFSSQTPRSTKKMKVDERAAGKKLF